MGVFAFSIFNAFALTFLFILCFLAPVLLAVGLDYFFGLRELVALDRLSNKGLRCPVFPILRDAADYSHLCVWPFFVTRLHDWLVVE